MCQVGRQTHYTIPAWLSPQNGEYLILKCIVTQHRRHEQSVSSPLLWLFKVPL